MAQALRISRITSIIVVVMYSLAFAGEDFPLRAKYADLIPVSTKQLASNYDQYIIVDVRSKMEFDVAHINKAVNIPISRASFTKDLLKVRAKDDPTPMAFYCNGHTCAKSYKAAQKAAENGFNNVFVYDDGIFEWTKTHSEKATLMGQTPAPENKIIPKSELKKRMLSYAAFKAKTGEPNTMIIDIRDPLQRKIIPDFAKIRNIPMDRLVKLLAKKRFSDKQLLILDAVGKQVRWIQYHLKGNGYDNYYFLEKGVTAIQ